MRNHQRLLLTVAEAADVVNLAGGGAGDSSELDHYSQFLYINDHALQF
jgi:hypothetical protein